MQAVAEDDASRLSWLYRYTICRLLEGRHVDCLVHYETLTDDLEKVVGMPVELPPAYASAHEDWRPFYDPQTLDLAAGWARPDLVAYQYRLD